VLYAYNYDKLGDSVQAKSYIDKFFAAASPDKIEPTDYVFAAKLYTKFPGSETQALDYINKAVEVDTVKANQMDYLSSAATMLGNAKKYPEQLAILLKMKSMKDKLTGTEYYYLAKAAVDAMDCPAADSLSKEYITNYPDQPQGYSLNVAGAKACDVDTTKGLAVEPINNYNAFLMKDPEKNKKTIFSNYYYLLVYYAQYAKQLDSAIAITDQMITLYPDAASEENKFASDTKKQLQTALQKRSNGSNTSGAKASATNGKSK
jgi:hypothetical protein